MSELKELHDLIVEQGNAWGEFKAAFNQRVGLLESEVGGLLKKAGRPGAAPDGGIADECKKALAVFARTGDIRELKAMSAGSDPDGGYLVLPDVEGSIYSVARDYSPMRRIARVKTVGNGGSFEEPISVGGAGTGWVGESTARGQTDTPDLKLFEADLGEVYANVPVTQRLLDDSQYDVAAYVTEEIGAAFGEDEGLAYTTGNGIEKPRGILTYDTTTDADAVRTWGGVQYIASGASGAFATSADAPDVLKDTVNSLKAAYRRGAAWTMNSATAGVISKMKDQQGRYLWADSLVAGQPAMLCGYPVEIDEYMPDIAAGSLSIAFGDFKRGYTIIDRPGVKLIQDPYTDKPNVMFYAYKRVGGGVRDFNAIKLMKFSAS